MSGALARSAAFGLAAECGPAGASPCAHVVAEKHGMVIGDMSVDPRFADSDVVKMGARFYAGMPLQSDNGHALGTLCLVDIRPRDLSPREVGLLQMVADGVMSE